MTDKTIPDVTDDDRRQAYEWAKSVESNLHTWGDRLRAPARVILHAIPTPPRPTLADMTEEERRECQWMQADVETWGRVVIIVPDLSGGRAALLDRWGYVSYEAHDTVTPRPDLPRMEWPEATPTGPDHLAVGTVIESADDPRLAALPVGSILLDRDGDTTVKRRRAWTGDGYVPNKGEGDKFGPWTVLHIPKEEA